MKIRISTIVVLLVLGSVTRAAEWQWSVVTPFPVSSETGEPPRAFLWVPPQCERVRGVVVAPQNLEEEFILNHPKFRAALAELNLAAVWVSPPFDMWFRFDKGTAEQFDGMMKALADESGYAELASAPVVPLGHSAAASFPWNFAAWSPPRTLAALSVSGQWPFWTNENQPDWTGRSIDGVPGLVTIGEYEWADERAAEGLKQRREHPGVPLSMLAEPAAGHFDCTDDKLDFLILYLRKACQYRLPADPSQPLKRIDPATQGWLVDRWRFNKPPSAAPAPVGSYAGDRAQAFWVFDEEIARALDAVHAKHRNRKPQLLGYQQAGQLVPQVQNAHQQVTLKYLPIDEDELTFKLTGVFLDTVPPGRPERWTARKAGEAIDHPASADQITITPIAGPVQQLGPDTFAVRFFRMGMNNKKRGADVWLVARHPGDDTYKRAIQQALLRVPTRLKDGADQTITFPPIPNQRAGAASVKLAATSDAGARVHYYVLSGPAEVDGDTLRFTPIPRRATWPIKVTVVAWQWGRSIAPKLKTAAPVERTFAILAGP